MPIPDYQACMWPVLEELKGGNARSLRDITETLANRFKLSEDERRQVLPSGQQTVFANRVGWAKTYLKKAGLLENPSRGMAQITAAGQSVLSSGRGQINSKFLEQFPGFVEFKTTPKTEGAFDVQLTDANVTPEESLEASYLRLRGALADEILDRVKTCSPRFFEKLVVELLVAMGYGGTLADAGQAVGRSGDSGIDGIIKEDKLGLDVVCIQAKRWDRTVGRPEVQAFAGSMEGFRARKGVLLTTSAFSKDAEQYVSHIERKIVLIDGERLANLMIDYGVGVETAQTYVVKKLDSDYFEEQVE